MNTKKNPAVNGKSELLSIRYPHDLVARMRECAEASGLPVSQIAIKAITHYLDNVVDYELDLPEISDDIDEEEEPQSHWGGRCVSSIAQRGLYREGGRVR